MGLDNYVGDIFNYVDSAGEANPSVPDAARAIYGEFRRTLSRAVEDGCSEIQILAHSLGSVITYHALTTYREETERLVSLDLDGAKDGLPRLTHVYTIGSPEKFRFFWPKLIERNAVAIRATDLRGHNFKSPGYRRRSLEALRTGCRESRITR
jgi:pimeloyl-ACP methyl ester carboxylesterase